MSANEELQSLPTLEPGVPSLWQDGNGDWWATAELGPGKHDVPSRHVMLTGDRPGRWETFDKIVARTGAPLQVIDQHIVRQLRAQHGGPTYPHVFLNTGQCTTPGCTVTVTNAGTGDCAVFIDEFRQ